jgi:hypothetical protein
MVDGQIENPDTWQDSLVHYEEREADYFEALKELFDFSLSIVRSEGQGQNGQTTLNGEYNRIREKYDIEPDEFDKLIRRATEFLRAAFANYLEMEFHAVRSAIDAKSKAEDTEIKSPVQ